MFNKTVETKKDSDLYETNLILTEKISKLENKI